MADDFIEHMAGRIAVADARQKHREPVSGLQPHVFRDEVAVSDKRRIVFAASFQHARFEQFHIERSRSGRVLVDGGERV